MSHVQLMSNLSSSLSLVFPHLEMNLAPRKSPKSHGGLVTEAGVTDRGVVAHVHARVRAGDVRHVRGSGGGQTRPGDGR